MNNFVDIKRYNTFIQEIELSYDKIQPLLLAEMLDNYNYSEGPDKYIYGNGTQSMLDMYKEIIYRNACMLMVQYLKDEYTFPFRFFDTACAYLISSFNKK
ncbi:hypothetical protein SAMN05661086_03206 [Anaeromicropila populeti]|uniref:Uncharacterized protein n=1 Tax=Anaeromicropila populeti TaxID=37658 RepID=A0A1I6LC72_9FIRM|nr:hypothetical protein SAMN05661086_03206 [Anaeromicropila populeti]